MRKLLVFGIILLFLGVGFQPALANEISTNTVSDVDEDCIECQPVSRVDLLKVRLLLIRLEVFTNVILSRFGNIPRVSEKNEEIYDKISTLKEINNELKLNSSLLDFPNIRSLLDNYFNLLWDIREKISDIYWFFIFFTFVSVLIEMIMTFIWTIGFVLGCWNWPV